MSSDSLNDLYVPERPVNKKKLSRALKSYLRLVPDPDRFHFENSYHQLDETGQILTVLLGQLARRELMNDSNSSSLTPMDVSKYSEIPLGRVYPKLRRLEQKGLVENSRGNYYVDVDRLNEIIQLVEEGSDQI